MPNYRRAWIPGGTYFFTVNLLERNRRLLVEHVDHLRIAFAQAHVARPFDVIAAVVLPDHLHCIWQLPPGDADNAVRWKSIKAAFSMSLPRGEWRSARRMQKGERGIWQRRYWEHLIRDDRDLAAHVDYVHFNPVKHHHVACVENWPYSTFHRYVRSGTRRQIGRRRWPMRPVRENGSRVGFNPPSAVDCMTVGRAVKPAG